jgi:hypothetical protein
VLADFTYRSAPQITAISVGDPTTTRLIAGKNFTGRINVKFGSSDAAIISSGTTTTSIKVTPPTGSGTVDVTVTTSNSNGGGSATLTGGFSY